MCLLWLSIIALLLQIPLYFFFLSLAVQFHLKTDTSKRITDGKSYECSFFSWKRAMMINKKCFLSSLECSLIFCQCLSVDHPVCFADDYFHTQRRWCKKSLSQSDRKVRSSRNLTAKCRELKREWNWKRFPSLEESDLKTSLKKKPCVTQVISLWVKIKTRGSVWLEEHQFLEKA